jgi:hypothetical protein
MTDWMRYQKLVLSEMKRFSDSLDSIEHRLNIIDKEIATLKVQSGVWGLIGGMIPVAIVLLIEFLSKK